jgi:addiction module HigA family antidote
MKGQAKAAPHPGARIKAEVIPKGMSVTDAAKLIGVSRPTLSNLLNGNSALSVEMATRLEKAFDYPREKLLKMQAQYEATRAGLEITPANTKAYVPPYLAIKANDLERWSTHNISARSRFPVLLRTLVHSTCSGLSRTDFPGNDDAERPGWDGWVETSEGNSWVPAGRSGWELGTTEDIKKKADHDYDQRAKVPDRKMLADTTFVFVTPRVWSGKKAWEATKRAKRHFKEVRAYDASDLDQWLEQSPAAQAWFANEAQLPTQGVRSLDKCWDDWAEVSSPPLTGALFDSAIAEARRTVLARLSGRPEGPMIITADSAEEALAFVAQILGERGGQELASYRDQVMVFDKPGVLTRLAEGAQTFIPVAFTREVERELGPYARSLHSIVVYPRNATTSKPDIVLQPASFETFKSALEEMGKNRDDISRLANASGRSLTVLRRQLSAVPAIRMPEWAADPQTAASLVPFLLVGAWRSDNSNDRLALELLAGGRTYDHLERDCQAFIQLNDAPLWSIGAHRGVISKYDLLFAIASAVTREHLERFFSLARMVLGEDNPALDLPEDQRWAAAIHGKSREFSGAFREGISETLVLLALNGNLFETRLGINTEEQASGVVRELLPIPLTTRIVEANDRDLPIYAEAAPNEFLSIMERDLKSEDPAVLGLLRPAASFPFGRPSRTGLLWALEGLSWNPTTLPRAVFILARLAQVEIHDNWINKPINSLQSIFRAWMPQTEASHDTRVGIMRGLAARFPAVAWKLCVAQLEWRHETGHFSHKPRWRSDGYGFGEPIPTLGLDFRREMIEMALEWRGHSLAMLSDLIERLHDLTADDQGRVWALIEDWAKGEATDPEKAELREKIRISTRSRRAASRRRGNETAPVLATAANAVYAALEPSDVLNRHAWLFREIWIEESVDELEDVLKIDHQSRRERIQKLRIEALREVRDRLGVAGLLDLAQRVKASSAVGGLSASDLLAEGELIGMVRLALHSILAGESLAHTQKNLISGAMAAISDSTRETLLQILRVELTEEGLVQLLLLTPFGKHTWTWVDSLDEAAQSKYWDEVLPDRIHGNGVEDIEGIERLLTAERPRTAFACIHHDLEKLDELLLYRILSAIAQGGRDKPGQYMLEHYDVDEAFKRMNSSSAMTLDQKAALEFAYLEVLARRGLGQDYGIPNLERYIELHPTLFVEAITWAYKRKDHATDPADVQFPRDQGKHLAERGYRLLNAIERIPGHNDLGVLETPLLARWIATVRRNCSDLGRGEIADISIGKVLSAAQVGEDGVWPCAVVRDVMEEIQSEDIMNGAATGVYNSRGVHWRGDGGDQERELAEKYRRWGEALQTSHPFVASRLLMPLAKTYEREAHREDIDVEIRHRRG